MKNDNKSITADNFTVKDKNGLMSYHGVSLKKAKEVSIARKEKIYVNYTIFPSGHSNIEEVNELIKKYPQTTLGENLLIDELKKNNINSHKTKNKM